MVKVVHIVTRLDLGGAQQNTLYTVSHLDGRRFEPVLLCGPGGQLDADARRLADGAGGPRLRFVESLVRELSPLKDISAFFQLYAWLAAERPEVVHTHSSKAGLLGRFAAALAGVPVIVHTFHGFAFHDRLPAWLRIAAIALERLAALVTTRLVFVSRENQKTAARCGIGDSGSYALIRSGIRLAEYPAPLPDKKAKRAALGLRRDPPLVVGVGNLKPQKNAEDFLRVAEELLRTTPQLSFAFIGDGPLRTKLQARALARGIAGQVSFLGWRRDVPEILAAADIFLLTSLWEGLPRSLLEAMRTGLPCVCYGVDGVLDVLREDETGFPVPPGDWRLAARRVDALVRDAELRRAIGARAAAAIGPEFDIDAMVRSQETLYGGLLAAADGSSP